MSNIIGTVRIILLNKEVVSMVQNKAIVKNKIDKFIATLKKHVTVNKVILFGSWANGNTDTFSDIDLAVFSPDFGKHKLKELQLLSRLAWEVNEFIEAITLRK